MYNSNTTLYPMLAVGAFMGMFWTGIAAGHALGVGCVTLFIMGLLSGCIATVGVCELQRRDRCGPGACLRPGRRVGTAAGSKRRDAGDPAWRGPLGQAVMVARVGAEARSQP
jgi:hypothetical protein